MIDLSNLRKKEKPFMALTSLTIKEFDELLATFSPLWEKHYMYYDLKGKARNKPTFREHAKIQLKGSEMKLFFILYYLKNNPLQESLALTFDVSQGKVNQWINSLLPILKESLRKINVLPARNESEWTIKLADRVEEAGKALELWVDGSEREIPRPSDYKAQKEVYSGKKKAHYKKYFSYR
ncbi:transposase family protein [Bernardetia sp. OM2101]|uniref:helix-turn-helix domain-containing protein n=1 Tax=Bernardetia sp. OM2101 TaxID=3344876 RepID=UPI0035D025CB